MTDSVKFGGIGYRVKVFWSRMCSVEFEGVQGVGLRSFSVELGFYSVVGVELLRNTWNHASYWSPRCVDSNKESP